jgi:polysaccharide deacetylase 2 family uncharacterized protein YibQ
VTAASDLTRPLGVEEKRPRRRFRLPVATLLIGLSLLVIAAFVAFVAFVDDPLGGEPVAVVAIDRAAVPPEPAEPAPAKADPAQPAATSVTQPSTPGRTATASEVEQQSGVNVVRGPGGSPSSAMIVRAPEEQAGGALAPPNPALLEAGRQGQLPKVGPDGLKPAAFYARPVIVPPTIKDANPPRIAILIGGMGISQNGTSEAITKLPPGVTLAFAPYGSDLDGVVQRARGDGHEVMLQAPMEPFDYPDSDPGPQTLLSDASAAQNLDRLHWQMSRFTGYVGIVPYMGAKFTASEAALGPVLKEIASRGLMAVDDGASPRSLMDKVGTSAGLTVPRADLVIDASPTPQSIDGALAKLEDSARKNGHAFGVATGLPVSIARIADWAAGLDKRGILLVPVTALQKNP